MNPKAEPLRPSREHEIQRLAEQTLAAHPQSSRTDPEEIASALGLAYRYAPFPEEFDGILLCEQGRFLLVCNERRAPRGSPRSRFTFGHELGHFVIPEHRTALAFGLVPAHFSLAEYASHQPVEREADCFAANLLMPESTFRDKAKGTATGLDLVKVLAEHFGTSLTSTAYRALAFNLFPAPAAIFRWDPLGRLVSRRMSQPTAGKDWQYCGMVDSPGAETLTARAIARLAVGQEAGRTHVMDWFPKLDGFRPQHQIELQEEVTSLGSHGWLTLVHA
jgi:hypothetical protein